MTAVISIMALIVASVFLGHANKSCEFDPPLLEALSTHVAFVEVKLQNLPLVHTAVIALHTYGPIVVVYLQILNDVPLVMR